MTAMERAMERATECAMDSSINIEECMNVPTLDSSTLVAEQLMFEEYMHWSFMSYQ